MSLRNQPYFPLYVQDYLTDEKLNECSAASQGIYIKLLCLMHKSKEYGKILLKQNGKQEDWQIKNFAEKLLRHLPFTFDELENALIELVSEDVLQIDYKNGVLSQKRMIKDNDLSIKRAKAGSKGGFATQFAKAKNKANTEYEIENEYENINKNIDKRMEDFKLELMEYKNEYSKEILEAFWDYWSEPNQSKTKMRKELQKTWNTKGRLNTWKRNNNKFNPKSDKEDTKIKRLTDEDFEGGEYAKFYK